MVANHQYSVIVRRIEQNDLEHRSIAQTDRSLSVSADLLDILHVVGILRIVKSFPTIEVRLVSIPDIQLILTDNRTQHIMMLDKGFYCLLQSLCLHTLCSFDKHGLVKMTWLW